MNFGNPQIYPGLTSKYYGGERTVVKTIGGNDKVDPSRPPGLGLTYDQQTPWAGYQKNNGF